MICGFDNAPFEAGVGKVEENVVVYCECSVSLSSSAYPTTSCLFHMQENCCVWWETIKLSLSYEIQWRLDSLANSFSKTWITLWKSFCARGYAGTQVKSFHLGKRWGPPQTPHSFLFLLQSIRCIDCLKYKKKKSFLSELPTLALKKLLFAFSVVVIYWFINCRDSFFSFNPTVGFVCRNADQRFGGCHDYQVRFGCPCLGYNWEAQKIFNFLFLVCFFCILCLIKDV